MEMVHLDWRLLHGIVEVVLQQVVKKQLFAKCSDCDAADGERKT